LGIFSPINSHHVGLILGFPHGGYIGRGTWVGIYPLNITFSRVIPGFLMGIVWEAYQLRGSHVLGDPGKKNPTDFVKP